MIHEQITLTVPRGTRAFFKKAGIKPEEVLRLGLATVGEILAKQHAAKNSDQQTTQKGETQNE